MPITIKSVNLEYKILPIELKADGSCRVTVRKGYIDEPDFVVIACDTIDISAADTSLILDASPAEGLSRRNDLALAVYMWLMTNGHVEDGVIS